MKNDAVKQLENLLKAQIGSRVEVVLTNGSSISGAVAGVDDETLILAAAVTNFLGYSFASPVVFIPLFEIISFTTEGGFGDA